MANSLKPDEARIDGRTANQLRPLLCTRGLLERAHGSARWQQENTIVMAAVYGPKNVSGKRENSERATVEIIWKMKSGLPGNAEKEAEVIIRRTLDYIVLSAMHPNTGISIIFQVVHDDGAVLACAINAACAALVDAGIPLNGLIVAVSCAVTTNGVVVLDPTKAEEKNFRAHVCLVFPNRPKSTVAGLPPPVAGEPAEHGIITCLTRGAMSVDEYMTCLERGRAASVKISNFSRTSLEHCQRGYEMLNA
ncbi:exosome complex component RRP46 [Marchantia polymorpha subsp. ruderalis]|uniref:Exoribonuclease phosphorolytic domain-containing protein n=2 Tax=Marchantia polymorpha TaxID=3197 RepID=A0AAF6B095_MARPO|nr:hypothetical protein MARPO_0050s0095 [Marchantia polymorpha]BBN05429.1 hypothetical protein Mp_3g13030 [Marchantia polymorpha subsp. ruderalis]|eukprot:PTQ38642.1 hypothetical protein MARPO_0050s0095 [Marchantia polymorpha]